MGTDLRLSPSGTRYPHYVGGYRSTGTGYRSGTSEYRSTSRAAVVVLSNPATHPLARPEAIHISSLARAAASGDFQSTARSAFGLFFTPSAGTRRSNPVTHPSASPIGAKPAMRSRRAVYAPAAKPARFRWRGRRALPIAGPTLPQERF
jgi:hypothetical protein